MANEPFDYRVDKSGAVRIFWGGRCVTVVRGDNARKLAAKLTATDDAGVQRLLQRATGNFRRGNERRE
ncbi:MAG: hypothetical protein IT345_07630 [Trueperaceae bacterium]|nr:hypothetical protein [Trueperaceae bacterium]